LFIRWGRTVSGWTVKVVEASRADDLLTVDAELNGQRKLVMWLADEGFWFTAIKVKK
jgi:hypothetical protein